WSSVRPEWAWETAGRCTSLTPTATGSPRSLRRSHARALWAAAGSRSPRVVETTPGGQVVATRTLVDPGAGDLFGLAVAPGGEGMYFTNDAGSGPSANSLMLLH